MMFNFKTYGDAYAEKKAIIMEIAKTIRDHGDEGADLIEEIDLNKSFLYEDRWESPDMLIAWFEDEAGCNGDPFELMRRFNTDEDAHIATNADRFWWRLTVYGFVECIEERDYSYNIEDHMDDIKEYYDDPDNEDQPKWLAPLLEKYREIDRICCALA